MKQKLYRISELTEVLSLSKSTIWKLTREKSFPQSIKITDRITCWKGKDIEEWIDSIGENDNE